MSTAILLQQAIDAAKTSYATGLGDDEVFEVFCSDNLLKNYDLTYDQVEDGIVDDTKDGGIDGVYIFINRQLLEEDTELDVFKNPVEIEVIVVQSKHQDSFKEAVIDKLTSSLTMLLNLAAAPETLTKTFSKEVVDVFLRYRNAVGKLGTQFPTIRVNIFYCSKGQAPNAAVVQKADSLRATLSKFVNGEVSFEFLGAEKLYKLAQAQRRYIAELPTTGAPLFSTSSFVLLCKISDYAKFISDPSGSLMTRLFEANVRAYQGDVEVNREIASSLNKPVQGVDFWWLNNGVTIVADQAQFQNDRMTIQNPLIVNGLQTSYELHRYSLKTPDQNRRVLVRVIVEGDAAKRDQIIKATNSQTGMKSSSLRATEPIHRRIEDYLGAHGLYYDRRKNFYKNMGKPADRIISIDKMAQGVMTVLLRRPDDARARPTTLIKNDDIYKNIFSENEKMHPLDMYKVVAELLTKVEGYFKSAKPKIDRRYKTNLKFHTLMVLVWNLVGNKKLPAKGIASIDTAKATVQIIAESAKWVMSEFDNASGDDRVAKDKQFTDRLIGNWKKA